MILAVGVTSSIPWLPGTAMILSIRFSRPPHKKKSILGYSADSATVTMALASRTRALASLRSWLVASAWSIRSFSMGSPNPFHHWLRSLDVEIGWVSEAFCQRSGTLSGGTRSLTRVGVQPFSPIRARDNTSIEYEAFMRHLPEQPPAVPLAYHYVLDKTEAQSLGSSPEAPVRP